MDVAATAQDLSAYRQILTLRGPGAEGANPEKTFTKDTEAAKAARFQGLVSRMTTGETGHALLFAQSVSPPDRVGDRAAVDAELDRYYANEPPVTNGRLELRALPPLTLPSEENIDALSSHASARFKEMLDAYAIPAAPSSITYDREGKMQLPADYPHTDELMEALEENPGLERELRSLNAIASHYVAIQERAPFAEEARNASSQAEIEQIFARYRQLLADENRHAIALAFSESGDLRVTANGDPILRS